MCGSMVDIQSTAAEIRRGQKRRKKDKNHRAKIWWSAVLHREHIILPFIARITYAFRLTVWRWRLTDLMC